MQAAEDRLPWPEDWHRHTDPEDIRACQALWGCVLAACLQGALADLIGRRERGNFITGEGRIPSGWIGSRDFHAICALAGLYGPAVEARIRAIQVTGAAGLEDMHRALGQVGNHRRKAREAA